MILTNDFSVCKTWTEKALESYLNEHVFQSTVRIANLEHKGNMFILTLEMENEDA